MPPQGLRSGCSSFRFIHPYAFCRLVYVVSWLLLGLRPICDRACFPVRTSHMSAFKAVSPAESFAWVASPLRIVQKALFLVQKCVLCSTGVCSEVRVSRMKVLIPVYCPEVLPSCVALVCACGSCLYLSALAPLSNIPCARGCVCHVCATTVCNACLHCAPRPIHSNTQAHLPSPAACWHFVLIPVASDSCVCSVSSCQPLLRAVTLYHRGRAPGWNSAMTVIEQALCMWRATCYAMLRHAVLGHMEEYVAACCHRCSLGSRFIREGPTVDSAR